jgi:outer membrane protein TolC
MTGRLLRIVVAVYLIASLSVGVPAFAQDPTPQQNASQAQPAATQNAAIPYTSTVFSRDYSKGKRSFPNIFAPYTSMFVPAPNLTNSPNIYSLIHDGKLEISLQDAIGLALQNDLNIAVEEYVPWVDETNLLNAEGGGTPASGSVAQIGQVGGGTFDPVIDYSTSISDSSQTVLNPLSSGVSTSAQAVTQATHSSQFNLSYTQELHSGTTLNVVLDNTRTSSSPSEDVFNPSIASTLAVQIEQPLLNGFGFLPHIQFIVEARNTDKIGVLQFEETVISEITNLATQYWNLVADRQAVDVAKQSLASYQTVYDADQKLLKIGSMSPADVAYAQSFVAETNQTLAGAEAAEAVQAATVLQIVTKDPSDPRLKGLDIVTTTAPEEQPQAPTISLDDAAREAWANRPELQVDDFTLRNDNIAVRTTRNALLPSLDLTGTYESTGLSGNATGAFTPNGTFSPDTAEPIVESNGTQVIGANGQPLFIGVANGAVGPVIPSGLSSAYSQIFHNISPTYAGTLSLNLPLRNRSAQAAVGQAKLNERQEITIRQRDKSSIYSGVNEALASLQFDAAEVKAAVEATHLYQESYDYAVKSFNLGMFGTNGTFFVVQYASQLNSAKLNEVEAKASYEIALANFNMALGRTLTANNITIASNGTRNPSVDFVASDPLIPGTVDGHLTTQGAFGLSPEK